MKLQKILMYALVICGFVLMAKTSSATTAEEMLSACRPVSTAKIANGMIDLPQDFDTGQCWGAFEVLQKLLIIRNSETQKPFFNICLPGSTTQTELIAVFISYMQQHPEKYSDDFTMVALPAMGQSFHCK